MKIKVCGITTYEDASLALELGADALGFNFFPRSPRYLSPAAARSIIRRLPPFVLPVGVFVNEPEAIVSETARESGISVLQLHGDEPPEYCRRLSSWTLIKALRLGSSSAVPHAEYPVQAYLLDAKDDTVFGGTGKTFDWSLGAEIKSRGLPLILADGLNPGNVAEAVRRVRPYAVDVCSGVESAPGKKDASLLEAFVREVRNAI